MSKYGITFGDFLLFFDDDRKELKSFDGVPGEWFNTLLKPVNVVKTYKPLLAKERPNDEMV